MDEQRITASALAVTDAMEANGWTPQLLADAARVDVTAVRAFLTGRSYPRTKTRNKLERALEWPTGQIARIDNGQMPTRPEGESPLTLDLSLLAEPDRYEVLALYHRLLRASEAKAM